MRIEITRHDGTTLVLSAACFDNQMGTVTGDGDRGARVVVRRETIARQRMLADCHGPVGGNVTRKPALVQNAKTRQRLRRAAA